MCRNKGPQWTKIEKGLPAHSTDVLLLNRNERDVQYFDKGYPMMQYFKAYGITHWCYANLPKK